MNVGFIGVGNMGSMLIKSLVSAGALQAGQIIASNRTPIKVSRLSDACPGLQAGTNADVARRCDVIFLCTRPRQTLHVLAEINRYIRAEQLLVVITNSIDIASLESGVGARVAKVIPSLAQAIGAGVALLMFGPRATEQDRSFVHHLFSYISVPVEIEEGQARVASDLTSCGPAFLAQVYLALANAAKHCQPDLPPETTDLLVLQTVAATAKLLTEAGLSLQEMIAKVSTPGGITAEGLQVLNAHLPRVWEQVIETTIIREQDKKVLIDHP